MYILNIQYENKKLLLVNELYRCNVYMERPTIILVGYGWASIGFLQTIDHTRFRVKVVSANDRFVYTPLLAKTVIQKRDLEIQFTSQFPHHEFHLAEVKDVDIEKQGVVTTTNNLVSGDILILAHGANVNTFQIPGVQEHTQFLKTHSDLLAIKAKLHDLDNNAIIAVIGCGFTGSELVGTLTDSPRFRVVAIDGLPGPMPTFSPDLSSKAIELWKKNHVQMHFNTMVTKIEADKIHTKKEEVIPYDFAIWCGGIKIHPLSEKVNAQLGNSEDADRRGIVTNEYLEITGAKSQCYAMGDCAITGNPPTAQVAHQQGTYLAHSLNMGQRRPFVFQNRGQFGYIGQGHSLYQGKYFKGSGRLVGMMNKTMHVYYFFKLQSGSNSDNTRFFP
jgi:NADH:ubiquinone reductase (non-electrogenic)